MFDNGKRIYFRDDNFKARFGTITAKLSENSAKVTLQVKGDDGNIYTVEKINPDATHAQQVEALYKENGYY